MSVIVRIIGDNDGSDEYAAAERLKTIIETTVPNTAIGEIILFPNATLFGQAIKDVDIMMIGNMKNYKVAVSFDHDSSFSEEEVYLESFCTTIEVKSHSFSGVRREGTNIQVYYSNNGWHNATKQSNGQKISAMNFFRNALGDAPYITNLIWLTEVTDQELNTLLSYRNNKMISNVLPASFSFDEVVQLLAYQKIPYNNFNRYSIESFFNGRDSESISRPLYLFFKARAAMGELTREKIEKIANRELGDKEPCLDGKKFNVFRGRAGTGKTIDLIRTAIKLVDEKGARVQILTYNRALVSDIRRLFALADLPDMFEESCVSISTMQSYFFGLVNGCLYDGKLSGDEFINKYQELIQETIEFLHSDADAKDIIRTICEDNPRLNWDYILIDEAQDWSEQEKELILLLYDLNSVMVADGGRQYVRAIKQCDWSAIRNRNNIKLKYCLRQKRNLVSFINSFSSKIDSYSNMITPSNDMNGGKVIVITDQDKFYHIVKTEKSALIKAGNEPYDMLFIIPATLVDQVPDRRFKLLRDFERKGILLWDGTNENNRNEYSVSVSESRVLQYESARGLEGWTVCCMNFDEYMDIKEQQYNPDIEGNALLLESPEDKKKKYILNWALIPLTRAIDTLIITLHDTNSKYSKLILELAEEHSDYIQTY